MSRKVDYKIKDLPYASITEFYNPEFTLVESGASESSEDLFTNTEGWFLIDQLKTGFEEEYLRLAHGFLKNRCMSALKTRIHLFKKLDKLSNYLCKIKVLSYLSRRMINNLLVIWP